MKHGKYNGLHDIARVNGVPYSLLQSRIRYGWTLREALSTPARTRRAPRKQLVAISIESVLRSWGRA